MSRKRFAGGFTLVELLVVIGIISILMSLLMPAMSKARESAQQVKCAGRLRQLGNALMAYASNNKGAYPGWSGWHLYGADGTGEDDPGLGWTEKIEQYLARPESGVYHCPSFPDYTPINYFLSSRWLNVSTLAHPGSPRTNLLVSDIKKSSEFVLSGDCNQPFLYPKPFGSNFHTVQDCDKDDATQAGVLFFGEMDGKSMHRAGNNLLFGDGHVRPFKEFDAQQITFNPRRSEPWEGVTPD